MAERVDLPSEDQLHDLIDSELADSKNTRNVVRYAIRIFEDYLKVIDTNLSTVSALSNSELDSLLQRFYAGARQKDGLGFV